MSEAIYCYDTASVRFAVYPQDNLRIVAEIEENPLRDLFGATGGGDTLLEAYLSNCEVINALALEKYRGAPGRPVLLATADFVLYQQAA